MGREFVAAAIAEMHGASRLREPMSPQRLITARDEFEQLGEFFGVRGAATLAAVDADGVQCEWLSLPDSNLDHVLFYVHGGAYTMGSIASSRGMLAALVGAAKVRGLGIEYRLAPEHPFPAGRDDVVTAYAWVLAQGIRPEQIVVAGDSAGGGLAVSAMLEAKRRDLPMPAAIVTTSAWADLRCEAGSYVERDHLDPALNLADLQFSAACYLGDTARADDPDVSPVLADLSGLPPMLVMVGTAEILFDDSLALHSRAVASGVDAQVLVSNGMIHCWTGFADEWDQARADLAFFGAFVTSHLP